MPDCKYPEVEVQLTGVNGNAYMIMAVVQKALRRALRIEGLSPGKIKREIQQYTDQATSGDYDHLLQVTMQWVNVT